MPLEYTLDIICNFFMILIIIRYISDFLKPKKNSRKMLLLYFVIFYVGILIISFTSTIPIINFSSCLLGIFLLTNAFEGKFLKKILLCFMIAVLNALCDIIAYVILMHRMENSQANISFIVTIVIMFFCEQIVSRIAWNKENAHITPDNFWVLTIVPICSLVVLYTITEELWAKKQVVTIAICVLIINVLVFYLYHKTLENYLVKIKYDILEEKSKAYINELDIISKTQGKIQSLKHDMKHHIIEMRNLINRHELKEVNVYLEDMEKSIKSTKEYVNSGNYEIDSLLNYLLQEAHDKLNDVQTEIKLPRDIKLNTFNFNVILGNLLENAIEAAEKTEKKQLELQLNVEKGILIIRVANSHNGTFKRKGDLFITTKENKESHGIGLRNVRDIVEEENGSFDIVVNEQWFEVNIALYI